MRRIVYRVAACWLVALLGCSESNLPPFKSWGYMNAQMNGKPWQKTYQNAYQVTQALFANYELSSPCPHEHHLVSTLFSPLGEQRNELRFENFPLAVGRYNVFPKIIRDDCAPPDSMCAVLYAWTADGDVLADVYDVVKSENNFFNISMYNQKNEEIAGTFQITLVNALQDTLRFTNGTFHSKNIHYKWIKRKL